MGSGCAFEALAYFTFRWTSEENNRTETEDFIQDSGDQTDLNQGEQSLPPGKQGGGVCGNDICEPGFGETKENCSKDCSGGD